MHVDIIEYHEYVPANTVFSGACANMLSCNSAYRCQRPISIDGKVRYKNLLSCSAVPL